MLMRTAGEMKAIGLKEKEDSKAAAGKELAVSEEKDPAIAEKEVID